LSKPRKAEIVFCHLAESIFGKVKGNPARSSGKAIPFGITHENGIRQIVARDHIGQVMRLRLTGVAPALEIDKHIDKPSERYKGFDISSLAVAHDEKRILLP
jgi:hypothetical protein